MNCFLTSINYCPVKSLSFQNINSTIIKKNLGILNDRIFAFSRGMSHEDAKKIQDNPEIRKLNNFLTLKNSPVLNKYNFKYTDNKLTLYSSKGELITIDMDDSSQRNIISNKLIELEETLIQPISLLKNTSFPFFDTSHSKKIFNSLSLINLNSIKEFENKINKKIEFERFRANFYVDGIESWQERKWVGKVIKINNVSFKVEKNIPRCVAINLKPKTDDNSLNLLKSLKDNFDHFDMGVYLMALNDGEVKIGNKIEFIQ